MTTLYFQHQNGKIAYDDNGTGPLVICVPSMGDLRGEYRFLTPQLVAAGYRVITMDVRGHGETSVQWPDYSVGAIGSDMVALIRHLNRGPATIIGTSMAAGAAVCAATEAPDLVKGLLLIGPFVDGQPQWWEKLFFSLAAMRPWGPMAWLFYFKTLYPTHKPADFDTYCATLRANLTEAGRVEALKKMILSPKTASGQQLPQVKQPVQVIMGSKDPDFKNPEQQAQQVAQQLRGNYHLVTGAGHYPHAEMPEITGKLVLSFLATVR